YPLMILACLWRVAVLVRNRKSLDARGQWLVRTALLASGTLGGALLLYGILVWRVDLLWPRGRTGLYVPILCLIALTALASIPRTERAITGVLLATACYFVLCLRLTWFAEWFWNANSDRLYAVVAQYSREHGVRQIGTNWRYVSVLNHYRDRAGRADLDEV